MVKAMANGESKQVAEIEVPEGMSAEQVKKLIGTFFTAREQGQKRDKAIQEANKALRKQYAAPYKALLNTELKKVGLPVKS